MKKPAKAKAKRKSAKKQAEPAPARKPRAKKKKPPIDLADVGFASGLAARNLSAEDSERIASIPLQDQLDFNKGRYTHLKDDGIMGHWGLDAVRARQDVADKPYAALRENGVYQTERIIFADQSTGATMMKLTNEPYGSGDEVIYFGKACWNANGSRMIWQRSAKPSLWGPGGQKTTDTHGPLILDGDGTRPRIAFRDKSSLKAVVCSPTDPDVGYSMSGTDLVEVDLKTEKVKRTIIGGLRSWWLKVSPDGKYVCNMRYGGREIWVVEIATGKKWGIPLKKAIHDSYRFVPGDTDWVMFWYEGGGLRKEGIRMANFRTGVQKTSKVYFDWNHGDVGRYYGFHCSGTMTKWDGEKWHPNTHLFWPKSKSTDNGPFYAIPVHANGYASHWPDDQYWAHPTRIVARPYLSENQRVFARSLPEPGGRVNRFRVCQTNLMRKKDRKGNKTVVLDRPNISPDGTKILFNSNVFGKCSVYMAVVKKPQAPVDVEGTWAPNNRITIRWKAPKYSAEIAGYHVYRSTSSGHGFECVTDKPVEGTSFSEAASGPSQIYYSVRAVEHSGLESRLSNEHRVSNPRKKIKALPANVFVEAEDAIAADFEAPSPDAIWVNVEGSASDLHYIWQRRPDKPGKVFVKVNWSKPGKYQVWARIRGASGAKFTIGRRTVETGPTSEWEWVKASGAIDFKPGYRQIEIASDKYGSCLDCFYLTQDAKFKPATRIKAVKPKALKLSIAKSGGLPKLSWAGEKSKRFSHYNVYAGKNAGFACDRKTLIASPDRENYLDWHALPAEPFYKVTQVTRDGLESAPPDAVKAQ